MDAWETLLQQSQIESGDAWEHLNNQGGGSDTIIYHGIEIDIKTINSPIDLLERYQQIDISYQANQIDLKIDNQPIDLDQETTIIE